MIWEPRRHMGECAGISARLVCRGPTWAVRNEMLSVPQFLQGPLDPWLETAFRSWPAW